jgi:hypothetical protein
MNCTPNQWDVQGFAVVARVLDSARYEQISNALCNRDSSCAGLRGLLTAHWCEALAVTLRRHPALAPFLSPQSVAVQCTLFEKSPSQNWLVSRHQDLSIPVKERVDDPELTGWSQKDGRVFVHPPTKLLEALVAVRVHIDDGGPEGGGLRVVPGSHRFGRLDAVRAAALRAESGEIVPEVPRGGVLVMRPLLLHASSKATVPVYRRVLHFVFGPPELPAGLQWKDAL